MKKNVIEYWESDVIPTMQFDLKSDAEYFDNIVLNYINNKEAKQEFKNALHEYPSYKAVQLAIDQCRFHFNLTGEYSEKLIEACELMSTRFYEECDPLDCYTPVMNYIFSKFYPKENKLLQKYI